MSVDTTELLNRLARLGESTREEWDEVNALVSRYPYSVPLRLMALAGRKVWNPQSIRSGVMQLETLYLDDAARLKNLVDGARKYEPVTERFDIIKEINAYQEVSFKTAPKSEILSSFLNSAVSDGNVPTSNSESAAEIDSLVKKSIATDEGVVSETLAIVLEKQGKKERAIEMYQKLMSYYPEKSSTFATRIQELQQ